MQTMENDEIRTEVRKTYSEIARAGNGCGCGCGCGTGAATAEEYSRTIGYSEEDISGTPDGADMGLGCGNPRAIAALKPGETVMDLGSGGGFDCFLAAKALGPAGRVIGVDMTADMVSKARENAAKGGYKNVEFRLGEIENIPAADESVDAVISNCVVNLSPEKQRVFREAYRVLKPGGRLALADIVAIAPLPEEAKRDMALHAGCVSGAALVDELKQLLEEAGFEGVSVKTKDGSAELIRLWNPGSKAEDCIASAYIEGRKPDREN